MYTFSVYSPLAQIKMVPTGKGGTNGVRHEKQKKGVRANLQKVSAGKQKRQGKDA